MVREITVDENYRTVRLFDEMKKGDIYKVPYDKKRHTESNWKHHAAIVTSA